MKIKAVVPNLTDVPTEFHGLYTERNGQFELTGVEGMRTEADVNRLQTSLQKERDEHKATKTKFAPLADRDLNEVLAELDTIPELKLAAAGKLDEAKINELVETRIQSKMAPVVRERDVLKTKVTEVEGKLNEFATRERQSTISRAVKAAARKAGIVETALEDVVLVAERQFELNEDGTVTVRADVRGHTPGVDPTVWLTEQQAKRPHWFGPSSGGGAGGNRGGNAPIGVNPFSHDGWNMTKQGELIRSNRAQAEQYAKAAGTTIGGPRPTARK